MASGRNKTGGGWPAPRFHRVKNLEMGAPHNPDFGLCGSCRIDQLQSSMISILEELAVEAEKHDPEIATFTSILGGLLRYLLLIVSPELRFPPGA